MKTFCPRALRPELLLWVALLSGCTTPRAKEACFDEGYWRGASDATKRHYWLKQAAERERGSRPTQTFTYEYPLPVRTDDGRELVPETTSLEVEE